MFFKVAWVATLLNSVVFRSGNVEDLRELVIRLNQRFEFAIDQQIVSQSSIFTAIIDQATKPMTN